MHLMLLLATLAIACGIRFTRSTVHGSWTDSWTDRWQQALGLFLLPPLLLMTSAIAGASWRDGLVLGRLVKLWLGP
jgi:hypothetical protein